MDTPARIKTRFERNAQAMRLRPAVGQGTAVTTVRVRDGFTCDVEDGPWTLTADMSDKHGGADEGPNPGVLGRAALGTCVAMNYVRWAAVLGIPIGGITVRVEADYDARGEFGVADVTPGYLDVRYVVTVESEAPRADVDRLLDTADACTTFLDVFRRPQSVRRIVHHITPTTP